MSAHRLQPGLASIRMTAKGTPHAKSGGEQARGCSNLPPCRRKRAGARGRYCGFGRSVPGLARGATFCAASAQRSCSAARDLVKASARRGPVGVGILESLSEPPFISSLTSAETFGVKGVNCFVAGVLRREELLNIPSARSPTASLHLEQRGTTLQRIYSSEPVSPGPRRPTGKSHAVRSG